MDLLICSARVDYVFSSFVLHTSVLVWVLVWVL